MDRREFIKTADFVSAGMIMGANRILTETQDSNLRKTNKYSQIKNILLLFVDQQRQDCLGCYGNQVVKTPNIDRLARNGIKINNAYTPAPVCTPARTSLQCGRWPHNHGLIFNTGNYRTKGGLNNPEPETRFFSESLRENGWQLAHVGKWHIGTNTNKPSDRGYEELPYYPGYGYPSNHKHYLEYLKAQGVNGFNLIEEKRDPTGYREYSGLQEGPQSASIPSYLANQTIDVIKRYSTANDPFFVSCNFWGPHAPYNIPKEHYEMYRNADIKVWPNFNCDLSDKPGVIRRYGEYWKTGWFNEENLAELIGEYYGYISLIDEEIGRILKTLEDTGELDSTLIIYSADHGSSVGSYNFWDKGFGMYDVITRIPMIISHPSIQPKESDAFVTLLDLAPTFFEIGNSEIPADVDGRSLMPLINGSQNEIREDNIITEHFGHQVVFWQRMVRTQQIKYIYNPTSNDEFYDLDSDPYEMTNIIDSVDRKKLNWARKALLQWMKDTSDPLHRWAEPML
ncbi:sulfatase-like hydrolase/transferase [Candidatus Latescibacterota bacterium]